MRSKIYSPSAGYTLIELMLVVAIIAILGSIMSPRFDILIQRATQSACKGNLGSIRSTLAIYYTDLEGHYPMAGHAPGYPLNTEALSLALAPKYIERLPTPQLRERVGSFNGLDLHYDEEARNWMLMIPPQDVFIAYGPAGPNPLINRPFAYDPDTGLIYICNGNFDISGQHFYEW